MPKFHFEHVDAWPDLADISAIDLASADIAQAMALRAAHEAASEQARSKVAGSVTVIARAEDGGEIGRARVTWNLSGPFDAGRAVETIVLEA